MKNLQSFEEFVNESFETLNEDANLIATVMLLGQASIVAAAVMARAGYDTPDVKLEEWWNKWKRDRRVNKILDKLNADSEVQQFLTLPPKQQEGKWKKLIDTKLNKEDKDLLNSISRDRVKRGKI
jgi:hypothetical protein